MITILLLSLYGQVTVEETDIERVTFLYTEHGTNIFFWREKDGKNVVIDTIHDTYEDFTFDGMTLRWYDMAAEAYSKRENKDVAMGCYRVCTPPIIEYFYVELDKFTIVWPQVVPGQGFKKLKDIP